MHNSRLGASIKANPVLLHLSKLSSVSLSYPCRESYAYPGYFHISKNLSGCALSRCFLFPHFYSPFQREKDWIIFWDGRGGNIILMMHDGSRGTANLWKRIWGICGICVSFEFREVGDLPIGYIFPLSRLLCFSQWLGQGEEGPKGYRSTSYHLYTRDKVP